MSARIKAALALDVPPDADRATLEAARTVIHEGLLAAERDGHHAIADVLDAKRRDVQERIERHQNEASS